VSGAGGRMRNTGFPITAWSAVNALGGSAAHVVDALHRGRSGLAAAPAGTPFATVCGSVTAPLDPLTGDLAAYDFRNNRIACLALREIAAQLEAARERWGAARVALAIGSSTAAMDATEQAYRTHARTGSLPRGFDVQRHASPEGLVHVIRSVTGIAGPGLVVSTACSSSAKVFGTAKRWLLADAADAVLVGGADSLCQTTLRGFHSLSLVSAEPARPFSSQRCGTNLGEGCAFALVERRGTGPRLLGVGESADAHHMSSPDPTGSGARLAMQAALCDAGVSAGDVDHVNAHGTGTRLNDAMEAAAIRAALGPGSRALTVSTKGYTGHLLGAAGATEAVFTLDALVSGRIPASVGADPVDPELGIEIATHAVQMPVRIALSNSFAFGGSNVSLAFGEPV